MTILIYVEDHVIPQLVTSAIEAYEIGHRASIHAKDKDKIETYGLLWGYAIEARENVPARLVVTLATIETSALRNESWVQPSMNSLKMKRDFFQEFWPHLELIGTFHSHPYDSLADVNSIQGWRASEGDFRHWPLMHEKICPDMPMLAHMIITITGLKKSGTAHPSRLAGDESETGYILTASKRKFWVKAYATNKTNLEKYTDKSQFIINKDICIDVPSLHQRFR